MPEGTCDPATRGATFNVLEQAQGDAGEVLITVRYGWDGVSTRESEGGCEGPLVNGTGPASNRWAVRAVNTGTVTYYAHTTRRNGQPRRFTLTAGQTVTATAQQASAQGYDSNLDFGSLYLTTDPNPPATTASPRPRP